jgi:hypothetical protein
LKKTTKELLESNRRRWPRLKPEAVPFLKSVSFSQGSDARVINISRGGILLETEVRLRPQMKIILRLVTTDGLIKMEGHILRSSISSLTGIPRYRSAVSFAHPFHMLDDLSAELTDSAEPIEALPSEQAVHSKIGLNSDPPLMQPDSGRVMNDNAATLTVIAKDGVSLQEMFKLNDW